jgi:hypothetical protein
LQLVFNSKISVNCQFKFCEEYAVQQKWAHNLHTQNTYNLSYNKIKSIYLSMRFLLEFAHTLLIVVAFTNRVCYNDLYLYR